MKKETIKQRFKKMKKGKRMLSLALFSIILIAGIGAAAYLFSYDKQVTYEISGKEGELAVSIDLENILWDVEQELWKEQSLTLLNNNGDTLMAVNFEVLVNGTDASCDETDDIYYNLTMNGVELFDGDLINIVSGDNVLYLNASAISERVCPRTDKVTIGLTEA